MANVNVDLRCHKASWAAFVDMYDYYVASAKLLAAKTRTPVPDYRKPSEMWWRREVALHANCEEPECRITVYGITCAAGKGELAKFSENLECLTTCLAALPLKPTDYDDLYSLLSRKSPEEFKAYLHAEYGIVLLQEPNKRRRCKKVNNRCTRLLAERQARLAVAQETYEQKMAEID